MNPLIIVLLLLLLISVGGGVYLYTQLKKAQENSKEQKFSELEAIEKASEIAKKKVLEAEQKARQLESEARQSSENFRNQVKRQEVLLNEREAKLIERSKLLDKRFDEFDFKEKEIEERKNKVKEIQTELSTKLEKIAGLSKEEAKKELQKSVEKEMQDWVAKQIKDSEDKIKNEVDDKSREILVETMHNSFIDYVSDSTTSTVDIKDEEMKKRIIGKSGRNIKTFERLTGVEVIIDDDSPTIITISCFDPIRREVAALAMAKLISSGKINPAEIEDTIEKIKKDILKEIKKTGDMMAYEAGFNNLPNEIVMLLGRFKYRFSYGQNLVKHTLEMVKIGETLAKELGADVEIVKLACLLHDIGKVAMEEGKQHHHISAEIAKKHFKDERLINAIEAHHYDIDAKFMEAEVVRLADGISGARPGARRDSYEDYVKRIRALEDIANNYEGVKESFAIRAGREVRVIVKPDKVTDEDTKVMAYNIAKEIEKTQNYPGVVKVVVIRETRIIEEAK